ncbi:sulfotransferase 1 family member D1-like [Centruroides vittatus]|uniref:sulfotransferase 1 family member D1-like n=1 Tax=Centruroides vittatus TaxID=120091 RepID=UPI003510148A
MEETVTKRRNKLNLANIEGFWLTGRYPLKHFNQAVSFQPRMGDVFVAGYPKSGTTWTQYIVWDILHYGAPLPSVNEIWTKEFTHLEMIGTDSLVDLPPPRLLKVNMPFHYTPYHPDAKYIYVYRNPWDNCVSGFNHYRQVEKNYSDATFEEFFQSFMQGEVSQGDYFDHILSWYNQKDKPNIHFLAYERMKLDPGKAILNIARFLGEEYYENLINDNQLFESIFRNVQFDQMKKNCPLYFITSLNDGMKKSGEKLNFFSKGVVGQWREYFTEEQKIKMQLKCQRKFRGTELLSSWNGFDIPSLESNLSSNVKF